MRRHVNGGKRRKKHFFRGRRTKHDLKMSLSSHFRFSGLRTYTWFKTLSHLALHTYSSSLLLHVRDLSFFNTSVTSVPPPFFSHPNTYNSSPQPHNSTPISTPTTIIHTRRRRERTPYTTIHISSHQQNPLSKTIDPHFPPHIRFKPENELPLLVQNSPLNTIITTAATWAFINTTTTPLIIHDFQNQMWCPTNLWQ